MRLPRLLAALLCATLLASLARPALDAADPPPAVDPSWGDVRIEAGGGAGTIIQRQSMASTSPSGATSTASSDQRVRVEVGRVALGQVGPVAGDPRRSCAIIGYEVALEREAWHVAPGGWNSTRAELAVVAGGAIALLPRVRLEAMALGGAGIARWRFDGGPATARSPVLEGGVRSDLLASWRCGLIVGAGVELLGDSARASLAWTDASTGDAVSLTEHARALHGQGFAIAGWRF